MDRRRLPLWQALLVFGVLTALYAAVSFQQYNRMDSYILDLGYYESLIRDLAHGHLPRMRLTDSTPAALHFNPALALVAPVVLVWSSPYAVLLTQAALVAVGVVPLMRAAGRGWLPWVVAVSYGLAPGFASLIGYDFHDVALGRAPARVQHGGDGARRPSRGRALGAAAPAGQGGPRPHARGAGSGRVPAWVATTGPGHDGGRCRRPSWSCWCGCCRRSRAPATRPTSTRPTGRGRRSAPCSPAWT